MSPFVRGSVYRYLIGSNNNFQAKYRRRSQCCERFFSPLDLTYFNLVLIYFGSRSSKIAAKGNPNRSVSDSVTNHPKMLNVTRKPLSKINSHLTAKQILTQFRFRYLTSAQINAVQITSDRSLRYGIIFYRISSNSLCYVCCAD